MKSIFDREDYRDGEGRLEWEDWAWMILVAATLALFTWWVL